MSQPQVGNIDKNCARTIPQRRQPLPPDRRSARASIGQLRKQGRWLLRKLQHYSVNVSEYHFRRLQENSEIEEIQPGIWAQAVDTPYDPELGLLLKSRDITPKNLAI